MLNLNQSLDIFIDQGLIRSFSGETSVKAPLVGCAWPAALWISMDVSHNEGYCPKFPTVSDGFLVQKETAPVEQCHARRHKEPLSATHRAEAHQGAQQGWYLFLAEKMLPGDGQNIGVYEKNEKIQILEEKKKTSTQTISSGFRLNIYVPFQIHPLAHASKVLPSHSHDASATKTGPKSNISCEANSRDGHGVVKALAFNQGDT